MIKTVISFKMSQHFSLVDGRIDILSGIMAPMKRSVIGYGFNLLWGPSVGKAIFIKGIIPSLGKKCL